MLQVVGAGVGRTGTHSLKLALEQLLGGPCHHMTEVFTHPEEIPVWTEAIDGGVVDWGALLGGYVALVDWPGGSFWPEISAANPDALVILSVRDPNSWYASCTNTIFGALRHAADEGDEWMRAVLRLFAERFSDRLDDPDAMKQAFERHNQAVRTAVRPDRLLEWTAAEGWEPLCARLELPVPEQAFPHVNSTSEFRQMMGLPPVQV
jgi:hypothetical protein